ncbi:MAG: hypothetical protein HQL31_12945, partial [Planctomycetes bacterium]|nr:hypothetical protein [Planctomycetota bacterium]
NVAYEGGEVREYDAVDIISRIYLFSAAWCNTMGNENTMLGYGPKWWSWATTVNQ